MATYYYDTEPKKKKSGFWGKFLAAFLGFLFGVLFVVGTVGGAVFFVLKTDVKGGVDKINKITGANIDYTKYISEDYAEKTVLDLVQDVVDVCSKLGSGEATLSDLNEISPQVEEFLSKFTASAEEKLNIAFPLHTEGDKTGLLDVSLSDMADYLRSTIETVELGALLSSPTLGVLQPGTANYEFYMLLCYGDKSCYETDANGENFTGRGRARRDEKRRESHLDQRLPLGRRGRRHCRDYG